MRDYDFHRQVFLMMADIVCVMVRRWKFVPRTIIITADRISRMPTPSRKVSVSSKTMTPMATAVNGSNAPIMAVGVAPTSWTAMVINTSERIVGTKLNQQAKNHARGDGGNCRCKSGELNE